jgi:tRNA(Ile2) C34 agmatinyltransferase TiaS
VAKISIDIGNADPDFVAALSRARHILVDHVLRTVLRICPKCARLARIKGKYKGTYHLKCKRCRITFKRAIRQGTLTVRND